MDRYYTFKFCGPSRSALQSGRNPLHVNVINDAMSSVEPADPVTGFSGMARDMTGMAEHMKKAGYKTVFSGPARAPPSRTPPADRPPPPPPAPPPTNTSNPSHSTC